MANNFEFYTGLRGYHGHLNAVSWKPYVGQKITLKREHNNLFDKFAVTGKVTMKREDRVNCCWARIKRALLIYFIFYWRRG